MKVEQLYTQCLAQGAYFISSEGEAAVIDPIREPDAYLNLAKSTNSQIKYIFETHFHADFVSGHLELAKKTGAIIVYGPTAITGFKSYTAADGECFSIGNLSVQLIHTPGHTLESSCYLLKDHDGIATTLFTGDTLFIGDVGRPDLAQQLTGALTQAELATMLYNSLRNKIMPLNDDLVVYPAHGAGSACGKNIGKETSDTLGNQKKTNYALNPDLSCEAFINEVTTGLALPPAYFPLNVRLNSMGYEELEAIVKRGTRALFSKEFQEEAAQQGTLILDTRDPDEFAAGHITGSINIGLNGSFATWAGSLLPFEHSRILIIAKAGKEAEVVTRLARVGFDNIDGYLMGGYDGWLAAGKPITKIPAVSAVDFTELAAQASLNVIDVRAVSEYQQGNLPYAINLPLQNFNLAMNAIDEGGSYYVYCAGGYRSMIFISMLKSLKNINLINIDGGFAALKKSMH